jgi:hypothetical protein
MSRLSRPLIFLSLLAAFAGCNGTWGSDPANYFTHFGGRVLNADTLLPLSGVTVKICNYEQTFSTDGDGHFQGDIVPGISTGTYVVVTFERSGYGSMGVQVGVFPNVPAGAIQSKQFIDVGTIAMRPGKAATTLVTMQGSPLANASVMAIPESIAYAQNSTSECTDLNITAVTNASGVATFNNLDPLQWYYIFVPMQDLDGDNMPDNFSNSTELEINDTGSAVAVDVMPYQPNTGPEVTGGNLSSFNGSFGMYTGTVADDQGRLYYQPGNADLNQRAGYIPDEYVSFSQAVTTANGSVQLVFWNPVTVSNANFLYRNNLVSFNDPDWNKDLRIDATVTMLAGSNNMIFNFTPLTPLPANEVVSLTFVARSIVNPAASDNFSIDFYVPLGLSTIPVALDNYNGSRDGSGGSSIVYLRFSEAVEGFYKVLSYTIDTSTVTFESPYEMGIQYSGDDQIINNQAAAPDTGSNVGMSGAVAGKAFTVKLRVPGGSYLSLNDDSAAQINTVRVEVSVRNIKGVTLDQIVTLPVE